MTTKSTKQGGGAARSPKSNRIFAVFVYLALIAIIAYATFMVAEYTTAASQAADRASTRINVAARQRALVETMTKAMLTYDRQRLNGGSVAEARDELAGAIALFHTTLRAFDSGGRVTGADGADELIERSADAEEQRAVREALDVWLPLQARLQEVTAGGVTPAAVAIALEACLAENARLGRLMNDLTARAETSASGFIQRAEGPRMLFIAVDAVALFMLPGYFFWERVRRHRLKAEHALANLTVVHGQLESQTEALAGAKQETDLIMDTVQEGLLLLDENGIVGQHHSRALTSILRQERLANTSLLNLLQRLLSEKMFNVTKDYFALLFDPRRKEKAVLQVNPLKDIEVSFPNPKGGFDNRFLGFNFRRIVVDGKVARLFVTVRDVTAQVELERKLIESEKNKERQMQILLGILHVDPTELETFAKLVESELNTINQTLRAEDFASANGQRNTKLRERLNGVFRCVHNIKGNACYLKLDYFQKGAEAFESKISELLERPSLSGDDFLAIVVAQAGLRADLADLIELRTKLLGMRHSGAITTHAAPAEGSVIADGLRDLVGKVSKELGKDVELEIDNYALNTVATKRKDLVRDVLIQLARNSLAHSVEPANERKKLGKPSAGRLSIRGLPRTPEGLVGLAFRDDGHGLDLSRIRTRAEERGLLQPGGTYDAAEIARCIFEPGFSTAATAGAHAGRGMGMDIIKSKVIDEIGGAIEVRSATGSFCEFQIYLPEIAEPAHSAR